MSWEQPLRKFAAALLGTAIRIAPSEVRDWGRAMLGELPQIESAWAAVAWAIGGAAVLAKRAIVSLFIPVRGEAGLDRGGLFRRSVSLRQAAIAVSGVFILGALLFFAAPPFRQGLRVSLAAWTALLHPASHPGFATLAQRARRRHDAAGLALAATNVSDAGASAQLAQEAVGIDPNLLWVYAVVALEHPGLPEIRRWTAALERLDPHNALIPLITAASIDSAPGRAVSTELSGEKRNEPAAHRAWRTAMAAAFASPKLNDYHGRIETLERTAAARYHLQDPQERAEIDTGALPTQALFDIQRYATYLLESGKRREARGKLRAAGEQYWAVARFGQVLDSQAHGTGERRLGESLQSAAYNRLQALSAKRGLSNEAALFAYLGKKYAPASQSSALAHKPVFGDYVAKRNAFVLQISALMVLIFSGLLIAAVSILAAAGTDGNRFGLARQGALVFMTLTSAAGLLLSSATVYLTYRPYSYLLHGALPSGVAGQDSGLRNFLTAIHSLPGIDGNLYAKLPVYFWVAVILAAVAGLTLILLRHIREPRLLSEADSRSH